MEMQIANKADQKRRGRRIFFPVMIAIALAGAFAIFFPILRKEFSRNSPSSDNLIPRQNKQAELAIIGDTKIYEKDIDSYRKIYYDQTNEEALRNLKTEIGIIQTGVKDKLVEKSDLPLLDLPTWDRKKLSITVENEYRKASVKISGAMVTVFFFNQKLLSLSFQAADDLALQIINEVYQKVRSGEITPGGAIKSLTLDTRAASLDWNYKNNTGITFKDVIAWDMTSDPLYLDTIAKMPNTTTLTLSPIVRYPDTKEKYGEDAFKPGDNGYYFFYALDGKEGKFIQSFSDWRDEMIRYTE